MLSCRVIFYGSRSETLLFLTYGIVGLELFHLGWIWSLYRGVKYQKTNYLITVRIVGSVAQCAPGELTLCTAWFVGRQSLLQWFVTTKTILHEGLLNTFSIVSSTINQYRNPNLALQGLISKFK